jgi:hypothetical protein
VEHQGFNFMENYTVESPVLHNNWDYASMQDAQTRAAQAATAPINDAVARGFEAKNQFLLNQINNQKQLELAKWQHSAQIQREQMRDNRMQKVQAANAASRMALLKQQGAFNDIKTANSSLAQLGAQPIYHKDGESDAALLQRIQDTAQSKLADNIKQDSLAISSINGNIAAQQDFQNKLKTGLNKYASDPTVQAAAQAMVNEGLGDWLNKVAPDRQDVMDAISKRPDAAGIILQRAGLGQSYASFQQQALLSEAAKAAKIPDLADKINQSGAYLNNLYRQKQSLSMMQGANGRTVPKPWWTEADNAANVHDLLTKDPSATISFDNTTRTWKGTPNPNAHPALGPAVPALAAPSTKIPVTPATPQHSVIPDMAAPTFGASAGGTDIDTAPSVSSPFINPLAALKTPQGLPSPSGNGSFLLDSNNQIQFRPAGTAVGGYGAAKAGNEFQPNPVTISPQDTAWAQRIVGSKYFSNLLSPNATARPTNVTIAPAVAPMTNSVQPFVAPNLPVPASMPGGASVSPMALQSPVLDANSLAQLQAGQEQVQDGEQRAAQMQQYNNMMALYNQ